MTRHCTRCDAEVEDTGGYCLLGHPLRLSMETSSLDDLKAEVEAAFATAQDEVRETLGPFLEQPAMATVAAAPAERAVTQQAPPPPPPPVHSSTRPTPPPPPERQQTKFETLWEGMEGGTPLDQADPINAFAPPPRMDWGPERTSRKRRSLRRLRPTNA